MQLNFACVCPGTGEERAKPRPPRSRREKTFRADGLFLQKMSFFENLWLTKPPPCGIITNVAGNETPARHMKCAAVAHLVERHLAKVEVASSSLVGRSISEIWFQAAGLHLVQALQANQVGSFLCGPVVQLVRTLACHARGRQFEPDPGRHYASVARSVEQGPENPRVIGSIPIGGTTCFAVSG